MRKISIYTNLIRKENNVKSGVFKKIKYDFGSKKLRFTKAGKMK